LLREIELKLSVYSRTVEVKTSPHHPEELAVSFALTARMQEAFKGSERR